MFRNESDERTSGKRKHFGVIELISFWQTTKTAIIIVFSLVVNTACDLHIHPLERRAVNTISVLIMESGQKDVSESVDKLADSESIVQGRTGKNTIKYLRARRKQGIDLDFKFGSRTVLDDTHQIVTVVVDESGKGVLGTQKASYLFNLSFNKNNDEWGLTHIRVEF